MSLAYENVAKLFGIYVGENMKGMSFKNYGDLLLIGGDYRTETREKCGMSLMILQKYIIRRLI